MNSISKAEADKRRQSFIADISNKRDSFCKLGTQHHPDNLSCEIFSPDGGTNFIKHGGFNLCIFVQFKAYPPERWVIRIPFPQSPWISERMGSEIATMIYVAAKTTIPVPRVHAYSLTHDNIIGSPFLIMNYIEGKTLSDLKFQLGARTPDSQVQKVYRQFGEISLQLCSLEFPAIGALGLPEDQTELLKACNSDSIAVQNRPLTVNMAVQQVEGYEPDTIIQQGTTFHTGHEFVTALIHLSNNHFTKSPDMGLDKRRGRSLMYAQDAFHSFVANRWLGREGPFVLTHGDLTLHSNNIMFDQDFNVVAVIDWEWSFVAPIQFLVPPAWLTGAGFGFMLAQPSWYKDEMEKLLDQVRHCESKLQSLSLLSTFWDSLNGPCGTAVATALLHPDYVYEAFWGALFWELENLDLYDPEFDIGRYSRLVVTPRLERFMTPGKVKLLDQKRKEQDAFWQRKADYYGTVKPEFLG